MLSTTTPHQNLSSIVLSHHSRKAKGPLPPTAGSRPGPEGSGHRAEWVDPTRSDDTPVQKVGALKKRLVATERERKQALAEAAAENRALQLQLQVVQ